MEFKNIQKEKIYLTGFMGTGKTTIGKLLSQHLDYRFIDTDDLIEKESGMTIDEIFNTHNEEYFRELERKVLLSTFNLTKAVISTGGGLAAYQDNIKLIKANGIAVTLSASPEVIFSRISSDANIRPLLQGEDRERKLNVLIQKRAYYYISAHFVIDTTHLTPNQIVENICKKAGI